MPTRSAIQSDALPSSNSRLSLHGFQDSGARLLDMAAIAEEHSEAVKQDEEDPELKFDLEDEASRNALRSVLEQVGFSKDA